jgi:hypothetical protein
VPDVFVYLASVFALSLATVVGGRRLGSRLRLGSVMDGQGSNAWPRGVQEPDVPPFDLSHAATLRREPSDATAIEELDVETLRPTTQRVNADVREYERRA